MSLPSLRTAAGARSGTPVRRALLFLLGGLLLAADVQAQSSVLVEIRGMEPGTLRRAGFELERDQHVRVEAVGPGSGRDPYSLNNAWILNGRTREVVWEFASAPKQELQPYVRAAARTLRLPAGAYEVYYAVFPTGLFDDEGRRGEGVSLVEFIRQAMLEIFDQDNLTDWEDFYQRHGHTFGVTVRGPGRRLSPGEVARVSERFAQESFVALTDLGNGRSARQGFRLPFPMEIAVYATGELRPHTAFDYGWILNLDTWQRVWTMRYDRTTHGGGAAKNRLTREVIRLPQGSYAAFFVTDAAHAASAWNAAPPYDPPFWGLTLRTADPSMQPYVQPLDDVPARPADVIAALTGLGNDTLRTAGFTLEEETRVRVRALGEGRDEELSDYGWITSADTGERYWLMRHRDTEHAGGSSRNRLAESALRLPAGTYLAHFVTDGSHSAEGWDEPPPFDPDGWGLMILPADPDFDPARARTYDVDRDPAVLARIAAVRSRALEQASFSLDENRTVRIQAVGEGSSGRLFDYAWIEDAEGRRVWAMTYAETTPAGGADRNRRLDATLSLEAGRYTVYYRTNRTHAFGGWNAEPPHDPAAWGVTVRLD